MQPFTSSGDEAFRQRARAFPATISAGEDADAVRLVRAMGDAGLLLPGLRADVFSEVQRRKAWRMQNLSSAKGCNCVARVTTRRRTATSSAPTRSRTRHEQRRN
jgi:hypothetical protein